MNATLEKEVDLKDHRIFQPLMQNKEIFKEIYEEILQESLGEIREVIPDFKLSAGVESRDIICDLLAVSEDGTLCNLELQNHNLPNFINRTRYYVSMLQSSYYSRQQIENKQYDNLPNCYSVWLCDFDPFKDGVSQNTIVTYRKEVGMCIEDGITRIFINIRKWESFSPKLQELFRFMNEGTRESALHAKWYIVQLLYTNGLQLQQHVIEGDKKDMYGINKMKQEARDAGLVEGIEQGIEQGMERGIEQGRESERANVIVSMFNKNFDIKTISDIVRLSTDEVQRIIEEQMPA